MNWPKLGLVALAAFAFTIRFVDSLPAGGLFAAGRYDDGVYYTAADSLTFGRLPYRDFVLLHPPGLMLVLTPFALLGRLTTDSTGMAVARLAFMAVGALNTVLVAILVARWNRRGAAAAGLLYAVMVTAVTSEQSTKLEPLGTTATLVALLVLLRREHTSSRAEILAGVALGIGMTMKIWYVMPVLVILGWQLVSRRWWRTGRLLAGVVASATPILLPFFVAAPRQMFDMTIRDQFVRPTIRTALGDRLPGLLSLSNTMARPAGSITVVTWVVVAVLLVAVIVCLLDRDAAVVAVVLVADTVVLLVAPTYFLHYGELIAAPAAIVVGIALGRMQGARPWATRRAGTVVAGILVVAAAFVTATTAKGPSFDRHLFMAGAPAGCVASDSPTNLIEINRLSSDIRDGCAVPVDLSGSTYDFLERDDAHGRPESRVRNKAWRSYLDNYLTSANSFMITRARADGLRPDRPDPIQQWPVLVRSHGVVLREGAGSANG